MPTQLPDIEYADLPVNALERVNACVVCIGWDEFAALDEEFDAMENPIVIDRTHVIQRCEEITYEVLTW